MPSSAGKRRGERRERRRTVEGRAVPRADGEEGDEVDARPELRVVQPEQGRDERHKRVYGLAGLRVVVRVKSQLEPESRGSEGGESGTHDEGALAQLRRELGGDAADETLLVVDQEREARRATLADLVGAQLDDEVEVEELPDHVCARMGRG